MVLLVLFVVVMAVWFLSNMPIPQIQGYPWASGWLAFFAVLLLGLYLFMPALRG